MNWVDIIGDPRFINFLSTFGLAVFLVLYFALVRVPKQAKFERERDEKQAKFWQERDEKQSEYWRDRYDILLKNYELLRENYVQLTHVLQPGRRPCNNEQAIKLAELGLDRDLYKLYHFMCEKLDDRRHEDVGTFIAESIIDTNSAWSKFVSPFPRVERIGNLYGIYTNKGESLKLELEKILEEDIPDEEKEKKRAKFWNLLFGNTVNMKGEFHGFIQNLGNGVEVRPYKERAETAKK